MDSFFQGIRSRELNGFKVKKRPYVGDKATDFTELGALAVEHDGEETPPLAISFCETNKNSHILAVSDEDGYLSLFDSRKKFPSYASHQECSDTARISDWVAHQNAIFDICWIKEDTNILTASGDQTIKIWDAQEKKCIGVLMGHTGSIKSMCSHPTNSDILVSGSRDGSFATWDLRCNTTSKSEITCITPTSMVKRAHLSPYAKRVRRGKAASMSITSVLYLKDEVSITTAGAVDSIIKFWDARNLKTHVTQACPHPKSADKDRRLHGISSLSQDSNGVFLTASCMDNRIYLYNALQLEKGPVQSFSGCRIESFYVKSAISPDATQILSGSTDGNAYIWQVNKPEADPITLKSHDGEVTAVDWCPYDGKIATSSDDFTVRIWNIQSNNYSSSRSPSSIRRRIMAIPSEECRRLLMNEEPLSLTKTSNHLNSSDELLQVDLPNSIRMPTLSTPEAHKRKFSSGSDSKGTFDKTPEAAMKSPSSVLNPPSSLKRKTIRDYFLAA
ncbi:denticleless protein homolog [Ricinus communis]|uniref:Cell division cycle protein cdt2, putative n=1 Tax=Ricinus communis TaxID=3988 RepID=B9S642_RICCO|nr:denticleless protein homolog [Ricinus communis]EEF40951.1 Cell division cycle protein cdt2, putative [Ricinus communis]|eukprot:XP_002521461.1 denticleless protein homolog [Ricinus communis]